MADFESQVKESQAQVEAAQAKIAELTSRIEVARQKIKTGDDVDIDIENATLDDVHAVYPEITISIPAEEAIMTSNLALGRVASRHEFVTTITQPELFRPYLEDQIERVLKRFSAHRASATAITPPPCV